MSSFFSTENRKFYGDYLGAWDDMEPPVQEAWEMLGWDADLWESGDQPESESKPWEDLSEEEQTAAKILGYTPEKWDDEDPWEDRKSDLFSDAESALEDEEEAAQKPKTRGVKPKKKSACC